MQILNNQQLHEIAGGYYGGCGFISIDTMGDIISLKLDEDSQLEINGYTFTADTSKMKQGGIYGGYQVVFSTNYLTTFVLTPVNQ